MSETAAVRRATFAVSTAAPADWTALVSLLSPEEHFRTLIEGSSDIIYEADASGCFTFVNPAVRDVLGRRCR
jgi:PAS domain-containing protein